MSDRGCDLCGHRKKDHRGQGTTLSTLCIAFAFGRLCFCPRYFHARVKVRPLTTQPTPVQPRTAAKKVAALMEAIEPGQKFPFLPADDWAEAVLNRLRGKGYAIEAEAAQPQPNGALREALERIRPEDYIQPHGRITRKWWRLGWLSAIAVAKDALAYEKES